MPNNYDLQGKVWEYSGNASWVFVTLPLDESGQIKAIYGQNRRGFGSIRVKVTVGSTSWETSIFPDKKSGCYFLPLKADVRKKESIKPGNTLRYSVKIVA